MYGRKFPLQRSYLYSMSKSSKCIIRGGADTIIRKFVAVLLIFFWKCMVANDNT